MTSMFDYDDSSDIAFRAKQAGKSIVNAKYAAVQEVGNFIFLAHTEREFALRCQMVDNQINNLVYEKLASVSDSKGKLVRALFAEWQLRHAKCGTCNGYVTKVAAPPSPTDKWVEPADFGDLHREFGAGESNPFKEGDIIVGLPTKDKNGREIPSRFVGRVVFAHPKRDQILVDWMDGRGKVVSNSDKASSYRKATDEEAKMFAGLVPPHPTDGATTASRKVAADMHNFGDRTGACVGCGETTGHGSPDFQCPPGAGCAS